VAQHKNLCNAPGGQRSLAVYFGFIQILTVGNCNIAESLNFGARELQADQLSTLRLIPSGGLKHVCLVLPLLFPGTNDNSVRRDQCFESFCIIGEPAAPNGFACVRSILRCGDMNPIKMAACP
jgi:hypothetical protein